jgi:hypothetical protein
MNMSEDDKKRVQLDIILKERPDFFIRWGLVVFVVIILVLCIITYYTGYDITSYRQR